MASCCYAASTTLFFCSTSFSRTGGCGAPGAFVCCRCRYRCLLVFLCFNLYEHDLHWHHERYKHEQCPTGSKRRTFLRRFASRVNVLSHGGRSGKDVGMKLQPVRDHAIVSEEVQLVNTHLMLAEVFGSDSLNLEAARDR